MVPASVGGGGCFDGAYSGTLKTGADATSSLRGRRRGGKLKIDSTCTGIDVVFFFLYV